MVIIEVNIGNCRRMTTTELNIIKILMNKLNELNILVNLFSENKFKNSMCSVCVIA